MVVISVVTGIKKEIKMLALLLTVVLVGLIVGVIVWGVNQIAFIPAPIKNVITVLCIVIASIWIILAVSQHFGIHTPHM